MKSSSEKAGGISVQTAWGCLTANLAIPGTGSVLAGRRFSGTLQTGLAIAGLALSMIFSVRFFAWYAANRLRLEEAGMDDPLQPIQEIWMAMRWAVLGIGLFGMSWFWALLTSVRVLQVARKAEKSKAVPPRLGG